MTDKLQPAALRHAVNVVIGIAAWAAILYGVGRMLGW